MNRRRFGKFVALLLAAVLATVAQVQAAGTPTQGDGGGVPPGSNSPGNSCYMSSGWGSNFGIENTRHGAGGMKLSLNYSLPANNSYTMRTRVVATGGDGSITYDSGWVDVIANGEWIPGGQSGTTSFTLNGDTDISGGLVYTDRFTDLGGQFNDAMGETIPPDPVTNSC